VEDRPLQRESLEDQERRLRANVDALSRLAAGQEFGEPEAGPPRIRRLHPLARTQTVKISGRTIRSGMG
jgi:hypothetical protein